MPSTYYDPTGIAAVWTQAGGSQGWGVYWATCVSLAESGGDAGSVSSSDDWGLWQINRIHFAEFGVNDVTVLDPHTNARIAIALSGNGTNWAAWCTAWTDPGANCGHGNLPTPQPGSPAQQQAAKVSAWGIGSSTHTVGPAQSQTGSGYGDVQHAWSFAQAFLGNDFRNRHNKNAGFITRTRGILK